MERREIGIKLLDEFGFDPGLWSEVEPFLRSVCETVFRVRVEGLSDWRGPVIFVANHGGILPLDAIVAKTILEPFVEGRRLRPLLEDYVFTLPWIGLWASRLGCVRASQENAVRLLERGESILAFPEGIRGAGRTVFERGSLMRFGRGGLVRLALRTGAQVVPLGIVGPEEAYPVIAKSQTLGRFFGLPFFPFTLTFPWLGLLGLLPLPVRFILVVGEPIDVRALAGPGPYDDACINRVNEQVRSQVLQLIRRARRAG